MEQLFQIGKVNIKYNTFPHILIAILFCAISPFIMGLSNMDKYQTAQALEVYFALLGIIFLAPLFLPDQDSNIRELIESKYIPMYYVHIIRVLVGIIILMLFLFGVTVFLMRNDCKFPLWQYFFGTLAEAIFLGGLGVFVYSWIDNVAISYMISIVYYMMNYSGAKWTKNLYLFSMMHGSCKEKIYLGFGGILFLITGVLVREWKRLYK